MSTLSQHRVPKPERKTRDALSPTTFPQFSRLPVELRLAIWGKFALRRKLYHILWYRWVVREATLGAPEEFTKRMDVRRIMQVNAEARCEVLQGHQLVIWERPSDPQGHPKPTQLFSFVNWELDLFSIIHHEDSDFSTYEPFKKIKNLAFGITAAFGSDRRFPDSEDITTYFENSHHCLWEGGDEEIIYPDSESMPYMPEISAHGKEECRLAFESIERVVLIIPYDIVWNGMRIGRELSTNEYGLHTVVDPTDHIYDTCEARLIVNKDDSQILRRTFSFSQWVQKVFPVIEQCVPLRCEDRLKYEIMLDHLGYRDEIECRPWYQGKDIGSWLLH